MCKSIKTSIYFFFFSIKTTTTSSFRKDALQFGLKESLFRIQTGSWFHGNLKTKISASHSGLQTFGQFRVTNHSYCLGLYFSFHALLPFLLVFNFTVPVLNVSNLKVLNFGKSRHLRKCPKCCDPPQCDRKFSKHLHTYILFRITHYQAPTGGEMREETQHETQV